MDSYVDNYIKQHNLNDLLTTVNSASGSTGAELYDYISLHSYVINLKPKFILECGTGKSTWILADALKKNSVNDGVNGKVISMESIEYWYNEAKNIFPKELKDYAEIHYSPATTFMYSFIKGTAFTKIPDHPYDLVFVDGPELDIEENGVSYRTVNMDFIRYLLSTDNKVTAIIDSRMRTAIAYGIIFGKKKMKFFKPWQQGIIENVTRHDMLINNDGVDLANCLKQSTNVRFANPSWLKDKI